MQRSFKQYPLLRILIIFVILCAIPILLSPFIGYNTTSAYVCQLLLLTITWWLYKREGRTLSPIGLDTKARNLVFFPLGILLGIAFLSLVFGTQMIHDGFSIFANKNADYSVIIAGILTILHGVINEELIFRGYCFQKSADTIGIVKTNILFAFFFLVWHWISYDAWGNYTLMLSLITTSFGHFLFATALRSSGTLYFSLGIHLGINWATKHLFAIGNGSTMGNNSSIFLIKPSGKTYSDLHDLINYMISIVGFLLFTAALYNWRKMAKPS